MATTPRPRRKVSRKPAPDCPAPADRFIDGYLSYLLARASHTVYREFHAQVQAAGLGSLEWRLLATLSDGDGLTIGELAREILAQQPTLTKLVQRMEKAGWVRRGADPADATPIFTGGNFTLAGPIRPTRGAPWCSKPNRGVTPWRPCWRKPSCTRTPCSQASANVTSRP